MTAQAFKNSEMLNYHGDKFWFHSQLNKSKIIPVKPHVAQSITKSIIAMLQICLAIYHWWSLNIMTCCHELIVLSAIILLYYSYNNWPRMAKKAGVQSFWKTSHKCTVNNSDERGHQYTLLNARSLNAQLLGLMEELGVHVQPWPRVLKEALAPPSKCTRGLLAQIILQAGREVLVG